jgi:hypothetical protein
MAGLGLVQVDDRHAGCENAARQVFGKARPDHGIQILGDQLFVEGGLFLARGQRWQARIDGDQVDPSLVRFLMDRFDHLNPERIDAWPLRQADAWDAQHGITLL